MFKLRCGDCGLEWVSEFKADPCMVCSTEGLVQKSIAEKVLAFTRKHANARYKFKMLSNDRHDICGGELLEGDEGDGCGESLVGNSYFDDDEDGEKKRVCDSCGHAERVATPGAMYMMNEKDWRSKY